MEDKQVNRRVKSVLESIYDPLKNDDAYEYSPKVSEHSFLSRLAFNSNGSLYSESKFDSKGNLVEKAVFKYDVKGNRIELDFYKGNGSPSGKIISTFDSFNKVIDRIEINEENKIFGRQIAKYDTNGNRIVTTYKLTDGKLIKTLESAFDKTNYNIVNNYFTNEALDRTEIYLYDFNGNKIHPCYTLISAGGIQKIESSIDTDFNDSESYLSEETILSSDMHEYDEEGNNIETVQFFSMTNKRIITQYKYDKNRIEVVILTSSLIVSAKKILNYDGKGNLIESFKYGVGGRLEEHQRHLYEYDEVGNWTKHKTIINNKSVAVAVRQIEYF